MATSNLSSRHEDGTVFTCTWKIDNINLYKEEMNTELSSPPFKIGITKPTEFQIYLNSGIWSTKKILVRVLGAIGYVPFYLDQKFELELLRADGEVIEHYKSILILNCCKKALHPNPALFSNERVLSMCLWQNSLTLRWKMYNMGSGKCSFRTVFHQKIFRWEIRDYSKFPTFTKLFQLSSLYFTIDLSKLQHIPSEKIVMIKFTPSDQDRLYFGNCTITAVEKEIIYRYGKVNILLNKHVPPTIYSSNTSCVSPPSSWEAAVMLNEFVCKLIDLANDTLILEWEITAGITEIWNGDGLGTKVKTKTNTLRSDLLRLYDDKKFCDVTLKTSDLSLPVHKSVLCARSPVFCAMFESDTEEFRTGVVKITDIDPDTLARMILFLYTDSVGDVSWEVAAGLYYAANKYRIQALKAECVTVLIEKLSVAFAVDALGLADTHQDEDLMQAVKDFVFEHDEVLYSAQWKELEKMNPPLTVQFFRDMYLMKKT